VNFWVGGTVTGNSGSVDNLFTICSYPCTSHSIRRIHAKGSNHIARREYGECVHCGKAFRRVIRWDTRDARSWWTAA
jgi:hypothetical protein